MDNPEQPRPRRLRKRRVKRNADAVLATDDVDGIYLMARRAGEQCLEILECSGETCRVIGQFCPAPMAGEIT